MPTEQNVFDILTCMTEEELKVNRIQVEELIPGKEWKYTFSHEVTDKEFNSIVHYLMAGIDDLEYWGIPKDGDYVVSIEKTGN